jgi:cystathionine beta-lyase/cystathionine gamma-synthase
VKSPEGKSVGTLLQHFAESKKTGDPVVPPITQTSLFVFDTVDELWHGQTENVYGPPYHYSRLSNPTNDIVEQKIAMLEGMDKCKVYGSGMGAISAAILSCVESGAHVVALDTCYGPTKQFLSDYLPRFGVTVTFVDGLTVESFTDAVRPETTCMYLESPGSIIFRLQDIRKLAVFAREKGITTILDNSYSTPLFQKPGAMGVDIVVHSATKYLAGHSDLTAGVLATDEERYRRIFLQETALLGAAIGPFPAWLLLRGLRTLQVRLRHQQTVANHVAEWLKTQPLVERVFHVGDPDFGQKDLRDAQMAGTTSLLSFVPKFQHVDDVKRFIEQLDIFQIGVSWGGFESLSVPIWYHPIDWKDPQFVVRLYLGLEEPEDLIGDLQQSFSQMS